MAEDKIKKDIDVSLIQYLRAAGQAGTPVDLDQLKVRILIICREKTNLEPAAQYLNRRGWQVVTTTKVGQALKTITVLKPDLVLMSVNINSPKAHQLPTVIFNTFFTEVITFGELSDTMTMKLMQTIQSNYKLSGATSGTNIQRRVKQILQEIYKPETTEAEEKAKILDRNFAGQERARLKSKAAALARATALAKASARGHQFESEKADENRSAVYIAKSDANNNRGPAYTPGANENALENDKYDDDIAEFSDTVSKLDSGEESDEVVDEILKELQEIGELDSDAEELETKDGAVEETVKTEERLDEILKDIQDSHEGSSDLESGERIYENKVDVGEVRAEEPEDKDALYTGSITLESTLRRAINRAVQKKDHGFTPLIEATEGLAIPFLWSDRSGVIVVTQSGSAEDRVQFERRFVDELKAAILRSKVDADVGKSVRVYFESSEIMNPHEEEAISFRVPNKSGEVCVIFSDHEGEDPEIKAGPAGSKSQIKVADIVEDVPVDVDLYVHLPRNGKYVKLIRAEGVMSSKQKQRLAEEMADLFIEPQDADVFKRSIARNRAIARVKNFWNKTRRAG